MKCYLAHSAENVHAGSWCNCLNWAFNQVMDDSDCLIKIVTARAGEKQAKVIAEVSHEGIRPVKGGRMIAVKAFSEWL